MIIIFFNAYIGRNKRMIFKKNVNKPYTNVVYYNHDGNQFNLNKYPSNLSTRYLNYDSGSERSKKTLPELYKRREDCCGCTACYAICPADAIEMQSDEEGFYYPTVNCSKCVRCYKCLGVCPIGDNK